MSVIKSVFSSIASLWLVGAIFILFIVGYLLFGFLWIIRFVQTRGFLLFCILLVVAAVTGGLCVRYLYFPLHRPHERVAIVIPKGCPLKGIADSLHRHSIITSPSAFLAWLKLSGIDRRIHAGKFSFVTWQGARAAADTLLHAAPLDKIVTVPEGYTIEQTAARIAEVIPIDTAAFIRLCRDSAFIRSAGLVDAPTLEGYLFPDTYRFLETATPSEMARRMVAHFTEAYGSLDTAPAAAPKLTTREIVILASIIEREAMLAAERPRIAGVFYNRLRKGYPLGADPTVRYVLKKFDGPLHVSELNVASPYNTRRYKGLPPGPICSPGLASLRAAVSPLATNELYFVARWDGSGAHDFSVTNEEHSRKKDLIRRQNMLRLRKKAISCVK